MLNCTAVLLFLVVAVCVYGNSMDVPDILNESATQYEYGISGRKRKSKKMLLPIIIGAILIKSILFPLAFKMMAVMSAISVVVSTLSLILSAIIGFIKIGGKSNQGGSTSPIHIIQAHPAWDKGGYPDDLISNTGIDVAF